MNGTSLAGLKVLVVEDDAYLQGVIRRQLVRAGCEPTIVGSGPEALAMIEAQEVSPDVMLTDIELPQMTGFELIERLRVLQPLIRAVLMSGSVPELADGTRPPPHRPFLRKPFDFASLTRALNEALEKPAE